jgi:AbrB family looped-hinge helix DNA binding protein
MDVETRTRVNENGRLVIPASYRRALGIKAGDEVIVRMEDDELRITTMKRRIERAAATGPEICQARHLLGG